MMTRTITRLAAALRRPRPRGVAGRRARRRPRPRRAPRGVRRTGSSLPRAGPGAAAGARSG
eukprot:10459040-Alexandrium_andersonii.AAC.1